MPGADDNDVEIVFSTGHGLAGLHVREYVARVMLPSPSC
jgi:hypothetical protein